MHNTLLPTTTEAVEAELDAIAADSPMGQKHPAHYKLGAAIVKLANANWEIERQRKLLAEIAADLAVAQDMLEKIR